MPACVTAAYHKARNGRSQLSTEEQITLLMTIVDSIPDVFIIIDAMDELEEEKKSTRKNVLKALARLQTTSTRLFITSRPHLGDVESTLQSCKRIEIHASREDIKR